MALQVWLPLTGDFHNQGLDNEMTSITGTGCSFSNDGKIGSCLKLGYTNNLTVPSLAGAKQLSIAYWCRVDTATSTNWLDPIRFYSTDGSTTQYSRQEFYNNCTQTGFWYAGGSLGGWNGVEVGVWNHYAITFNYETGVVEFYINGQKKYTQTNLNTTHYVSGINIRLGDSGLEISENDMRIYDHVLSAKEISELAKGLVLHYPLNNDGVGNKNLLSSIDTSFLSYSDGACTIFTNQMNGGTQEIVSNITGATKCVHMHSLGSNSRQYITIPCYAGKSYTVSADYYSPTSQSTAFRGELNGGEYSWTASNSGAYTTPNQWERKSFSYTALVNDATLFIFIYCANGSDCYVKNIKVEEGLIATPYIPAFNDATYGVGTVIHDTSGYGNNGTVNGTLVVSSDSPRYSVSTYVNGSSTITHPRCLSNTNQEWTCCAWVKLDDTTSYQKMNNFNEGNHIRYSTTPLLYLNSGTNDYYIYGSEAVPAGTWTHVAFVFKNSTGLRNIYINGVLKNSSGPNKTLTPYGIPETVTCFPSPFAGYVSDYREYATALSPDDVLELYHTSASLADNGTLFAYEFNET